jgi:hypothetical protein
MAKLIKITNKQGKELEVTEKAFDIVYKAHGYKVVEIKKKKKDDK